MGSNQTKHHQHDRSRASALLHSHPIFGPPCGGPLHRLALTLLQQTELLASSLFGRGNPAPLGILCRCLFFFLGIPRSTRHPVPLPLPLPLLGHSSFHSVDKQQHSARRSREDERGDGPPLSPPKHRRTEVVPLGQARPDATQPKGSHHPVCRNSPTPHARPSGRPLGAGLGHGAQCIGRLIPTRDKSQE